MEPPRHPWEDIYRQQGRIFHEPFPGFEAVAAWFSQAGCRRILDLGCGNGRHLVALRQAGFEAIGLDISPSGLRLARDWLGELGLPASLVAADARRALPLQDASVDGVFSTQVIHHALLTEVRRTITELGRVLRAGGLAFVTVPTQTDPEVTHREIEPGTFVPLAGPEAGLPHHIFTAAELETELAGFTLVDRGRLAEGRILALWLRKPAV